MEAFFILKRKDGGLKLVFYRACKKVSLAGPQGTEQWIAVDDEIIHIEPSRVRNLEKEVLKWKAVAA